MNTAGNYSEAQKEIIRNIEEAGLYSNVTTNLLVLMSTNNYIRSVDDLAGILCEYPGMPNPESLKKEINNCVQEGYLKKKLLRYIEYCYQDSECLEKYLSNLPSYIQEKIINCRTSYQGSECVRVLGLLSGGTQNGYINDSFLQELSNAQREILLPMLNTSPNQKVIEILKERASNGVKVKILLPDYEKVVSKIRCGKEDMTNKWVEQLAGTPNIEIRKYFKIEGAYIYSSLLIDKTFCRICVFDPVREKSSNGTLIEIHKNGYDLNLIKMFIDKFNDIWFDSMPVTDTRFTWLLKNKIFWLIVGISVSLVTYLNAKTPVRDISLNVMMALCGAFITSTYKDIFATIKKIYNKLTWTGDH